MKTNTRPMSILTRSRHAALAALFMAFALTAIAPDNAAAQATSLDLGTVTVDVNGTDTNLDLILIRPITTTATAGGKLYYYLDPDNSNAPNGADSRTHDVLNALLNDGDDTIDTQTTGTGHDGSDDERSVIVGPYALILPTLAEWTTLHSDRNPISLSPRWPGTDFHTATLASPASHNFFRLDNGGSSTGSRGSLYRVAFQVITLPPAAPTGVTLTPGHEQITVMWTAVSDTSTPTLTYTNTATATDTTDASNTFTCNANSRTETDCTIASLNNGTTYSVTVVATNNHGTSTPSAALMSAPVATAQPTHLTLSLGTHEDINLNLIFPVILNDDTPETTDDKLYYYVDRNGNGTTSETVDSHIRDGDAVNFDMLDNLFNGGANVIVTQEPEAPFRFGMPGTAGDHDGTEDERSVIIGNYAVVLPTFNELHALYLDQGDMPPADWPGRNSYRTATPQGNARHYAYHFSGPNQASAIDDEDTSGRVAVQVITLDVTAPTAAPTAVTATPTIDNTVRIEWTALLDADNGGAAITTYTATATPAGTFTGDDGTCTDDGTTITTDGNITCTITGLMHDITYDVTVTATNSVGTGDPSTAARVIPGRPAVPQGVTLDPGNGQIIVRWTLVPSGDTGGADVTGYRTRLFNSPVGGPDRLDTDDACTADATTDTCTITGLTSGNRYRVVVHATNIRGDSIASDSDFAILSGLSFTPARIADQTLSVDQPDVAIVLPAAGAGNPPYTYALARSDSSTPLLPSGLVFNPANRTISGTPTEAFGTNGGVEFLYTATDSDNPPDSGTLTFRLTVNDDAILIGSFGGINLNLRYPVTVGGKNYYYNDANNNGTAERTVIRAVPGDDVSIGQLRSLLNDGNPIPETPDAQRSVVVGAYTLMLPTIAEMVALRAHPPTGSSPANWNNDIYHTATDSMNNRVFSLFDGRRYESSPTVAWPVAFQVIIAATAPTAAPTGVTARPTTDATTLRIDWTPVRIRDNGGAPITTYTATATPTGTFTGTGDAATCTADGPTATNCDISGLTNGTEYSVDVIATNSAGNSLKSDTVTVIPGRPAAPAGVTLTPGDMEIMVTWTAVPDENNGGEAVTSYKVAADVSNADALTHGVDGGVRGRCTATAPATACTITGLVNGVPHRVIVRATNGRGDSIASSGVSATPVGEVGLTLTPGALTMDEGGTATYTAVLGTQPNDTVTVTISSNNTYVAADPTPLTFATTDWNRAQTVTITAAEDADAVDETPVTLTHDVTGGGYDAATGTVMVTVIDNDLGFDPDTIEDQRHNINQALTLPLPVATGGVGTVTYTLTRPNGTPVLVGDLTFDNLTHTITGVPTTGFGPATLEYTAADSASAKTGTLTFSFRVTPVPALTLTPAALTFAEGSTTTYTAVLTSQPTADVTVAIAVPDSTDLTVMTPSAGMLTFTTTNWNAAQTVTLTAAEDDDAVDDSATLTHTAASGDSDYNGLTGTVMVIVTDVPRLILPSTLTLAEGTTATYTVALTTTPSPSAAVTVTITGHDSNTNDVTPTPDVLTFTTANSPQTVTITAAEDDDLDDDAAVTLTHTATTVTGGNYAGLTGDVMVTVTDNDTLPMFSATGIANRIYPVGVAIPTLTLPAATGGSGTLTYALNGALPTGLAFTGGTSSTSSTLSGTPSAAASASLTYTFTDTGSGLNESLIFSVSVVTVTVTNGGGAIAEADEDGTALAVNNVGSDNDNIDRDLRLFLPDGHSVTTVTVNTYTAGVGTLPANYTFSGVAMDIDLGPGGSDATIPQGTEATVCLSATDVPPGHQAALLLANAAGVPASWTAIGTDITTRPGFVCATTDEFAPYFAVAYISESNAPAPLSLASTMVDSRIYPVGVAIPTLTLPAASGGLGTLSYTLTPAASIPAGLTFDPVTQTLVGTPTANTAPTSLIYAVTDRNRAEVTLAFRISVVTVTVTDGAEAVTDLDGTALAVNNVGMDNGDTDHNLRLFLPDGHIVNTVTVKTYTPTAGTEPTDYTFSGVAMDIDLTPPSNPSESDPSVPTNATVCLSTTGITGNTPALFHGGVGTGGTVWANIGSDTTTRDGFVCGTTTNFMPFFAVASMPTTSVAPSTPLSFASTVSDRIYPVSTTPITLTLPEARGGTGTLMYDLTQTPSISGLSFNATARTLSGILNTAASASLVYTATDSGTPQASVSLTFSVSVVTVTVGGGGTFEAVEDGAALAVNNVGGEDNDVRISLPDGTATALTALTVNPYTPDAAPVPAAGYAFSGVAVDIELPENTRAFVCLSTVGVPNGHNPALFHGTSEADPTWTNIGEDDTTRSGFVCGTATTFSPFIVGSRAASEDLNEQILSRASQAMTASVSARVAARVEAAAGNGGINSAGDPSALAYQFGGQSSMRGLLQAHGKAMLEGEMDYERLLEGASFVLPLSAAGDEGGGKLGALSLWGGADFSNLDGDTNNLDWDGEIVSFHLGVDAPVGNNMLAGLALSRNTASFDFTHEGRNGDYDYTTTNLHPYLGYIHNEKLNFWGAAGFGEGEIEIEADAAEKTDADYLSLAGGFSNQIARAPGRLPGSVISLNIKGDASVVQVDVDAADGINAQEVSSNHIRLLMSGEHRRELAGGGSLAPSMEAGVRYDGGDGAVHSGIEIGAGLRYADPGGRLTLTGNVRGMLLDDYDAWGADFTVHLAPQSGRGLSLSLQPVWGQTQSTAERLWDEGAAELGGGDTALQSRMNSEVGYGIAATMLGSVGVLTPYTGMTTVDGGVSHVRLGGRFAGGTGLRLNLEGARENSGDSASNTVLLRGELAF